MKPLTVKQEIEFALAKTCDICEKAFTSELESDRVKDHCHTTGKYRGPAHDKCNLKYTAPDFVPVVAHNVRGYDSHIIVEAFGNKDIINRLKINDNDKIKSIPNDTVKYISVTLGS